MNSKNTGRIEHNIQPGDYFLNNDKTWLRNVQDCSIYSKIIVTSYGLKEWDIQDNLEFNQETLLLNKKLSKKQAIKMLKVAGYEV